MHRYSLAARDVADNALSANRIAAARAIDQHVALAFDHDGVVIAKDAPHDAGDCAGLVRMSLRLQCRPPSKASRPPAARAPAPAAPNIFHSRCRTSGRRPCPVHIRGRTFSNSSSLISLNAMRYLRASFSISLRPISMERSRWCTLSQCLILLRERDDLTSRASRGWACGRPG